MTQSCEWCLEMIVSGAREIHFDNGKYVYACSDLCAQHLVGDYTAKDKDKNNDRRGAVMAQQDKT